MGSNEYDRRIDWVVHTRVPKEHSGVATQLFSDRAYVNGVEQARKLGLPARRIPAKLRDDNRRRAELESVPLSDA